MKRLLTLFFAFFATTLGFAQIRSYSDIETKTFVIGLDSYFFGESGALDFQTAGTAFQASISGEEVRISVAGSDTLLEKGAGEKLVGVHDFTGDRQLELVVATHTGQALIAHIYRYTGNGWSRIGRIGAEGPDVADIRVFRQALTIKNHASGALYTWTWHTPHFDFKASDGSADPTPAL